MDVVTLLGAFVLHQYTPKIRTVFNTNDTAFYTMKVNTWINLIPNQSLYTIRGRTCLN